MKFILLLVCGVAFLQNYALGRPDLNGDTIVGVSQKKLEEYLTKAANGFKKIMSKGDEEQDYPVMEPYKAAPFSWEYTDASGNKKLNLIGKGETIIKGLSNFYFDGFTARAKDMRVSVGLEFDKLEAQFPYKLDGYLYKNFMPIYGEGLIKLFAYHQGFQIIIDLGTEKGYIRVEDVNSYRYYFNADIKVTGLMDLPDKFSSSAIDDILHPLVDTYGDKMISKLVRDVIEEAVGGMTTDELFDLLDYFVKKNNEDEN